MPLGERPPLVVFLESQELHIRVLWGAPFMTLSFAQPTPEEGKVLAFARDIRLGLLPAIVVVQPEWLTPADVAVPPTVDMEALLVSLAPRDHGLPQDTSIIERFSVPSLSLAPLSLVNLLMVYHFLAPATTWHMMHEKADAMGMNQRVALFLDWLRAATIEPLQGINALTSVDLADSTLTQHQVIRTSRVPPPPLRSPQARISRCIIQSICKRRPHRQPP